MNIPITFLVDDPAPLINVYWWHVANSHRTEHPTQGSGEPIERLIPLDFLEEFAAVISRWEVRGKFSVLPYPAGLGSIDAGWKGCDTRALTAWLDLVRAQVAPRMDITPEILTHARAVDLSRMQLLDEDERQWARHQTAATLTPYIGHALKILNAVDLPASGVTSPWDFGITVEEEYRQAIVQSMREVNDRQQTWYFLHADDQSVAFRSQVVYRQDDAWLVSLYAQVDDLLWQTMETRATDLDYVRKVADGYLTQDGKRGRLSELFRAGTPMVLCTHWQSLYSNGRRTGLRVLDKVCNRLHALWGDRVEWTTCNQLARKIADGSL